MKDSVWALARTALAKKEFRYLVAGGLSELIEILSFIGLYALLSRLYVANSLSFGLGVLSGFAFHKLWSFAGEHRFKTRYQLFGYVGLAGFNFIMLNVLIGLYVNRLGLLPALGKVLAITTSLVWTYPLTNKVIFRHQKAATPSDEQ